MSKPAGLHQGSDNLDFDSVISQQGPECRAMYESLEHCLVRNDRNWTKCQEELKQWKKCFPAPSDTGKK